LVERVEVGKFGEPEDPAWYHVTMVYLGDDVPAETLEGCMSALLDVAGETEPFEAAVREVGTFAPHPEKGTVPVIGKVESDDLHRLRERVCATLKEHGVAYDEKFPVYRPHVTLAYSGDPAVHYDGAANKNVDPGVRWEVTDIVVWGGDQGEDRVSMTFPFKTTMSERLARRVQAAADPPADFKLFNDRAQAFLKEQDMLQAALKAATKRVKEPGSATPAELGLAQDGQSKVVYEKWPQYIGLQLPGDRLFLGILGALTLPDALRKKVEAAARVWAKRPSRPRMTTRNSTFDYLTWYDRQATAIGTQLDVAVKALAAGKAHGEAGDEGTGAGTKIKVGPFTLVNTGGFKPDVMANMEEIVQKSTQLIQRAGLGACCYGPIQITNTLMRSNVLAFYQTKDDGLYIRANGKPEWDTVHTVIHELGHRWENKQLPRGVADTLYQAIAHQDKTERKMPTPAPGDTVKSQGKVFEVVSADPYHQVVRLKPEGGRSGSVTTSFDTFYALKGVTRKNMAETDPNYKGFVTNYAKTSPAENFAEMFAFYCMDKLPVHQSVLFEKRVFGDGKTARDLGAIRAVLGSIPRGSK
jgi:2'-5' RNA ligase